MTKRRLPLVARVLLISGLLLSSGGSQPKPTVPTSDTPVTALPPEVRLRKLHLVRPDLIQFPVCYEIYC